MYNAIKWAFKLGQQTERHRIAGILNVESAYIAQNYMYDMPNNIKDGEKQRIKFRQAVDQRVQAIIENITRPKELMSEQYSLLYPKDDK